MIFTKGKTKGDIQSASPSTGHQWAKAFMASLKVFVSLWSARGNFWFI